jgi:hypothetical protein
LFIVLYNLGVSPYRLHRWYYGDAATSTPREKALSS